MFVKKDEFKPFESKVWLSSPTMHGDEMKYVAEAYETNWMSTVGKNIDETERLLAERVGVRYAVALSAGTASLHLAVKLAGEAMYGQAEIGKGALHIKGKRPAASAITAASASMETRSSPVHRAECSSPM